VTVAPAITPVYLHSPNFLQKTPAKKSGSPQTTSRRNPRLKSLLKIRSFENATHNHTSKTKKRSPEGLRFPSTKQRS
jgi:hypothetical protein